VTSAGYSSCASRIRVLARALVLAVAATAALGPVSAGTAGELVVAKRAELSGDDKRTRFSMVFSGEVSYSLSTLGDPYRVVIDLPDVEFKLPDGTGTSRKGLIAAFRYGLFAPGKARVVMDAEGPVLIENANLAKAEGGYRLDFDVVATDAATFAAGQKKKVATAASSSIAVFEVPKPRLADPRVAKPIVVIDPGHGGVDSGAISPDGTKEKHIVLAVGKKLAAKLEKSGRYKVLMTRDSDVFISLPGRVEFTRRNGANLFISIHADSADDDRWLKVRGASVYTRSEKASDDAARRLAIKENMSDIMAGIELPETEDEALTDILSDLVQRETRLHSELLSQEVIKGLRTATAVLPEPGRSAAFHVLKSPEVPSVLIELGFVSNKDEVKDLSSEKWQDRTTTALAKAVDRFFEQRVTGFPF
jgi:N-acetylmuramoyl-L-alanine amidase